MKKICMLLVALLALTAVEAQAKEKKIKVKNEFEFLKALDNDRTVVIAKGKKLNLTKVLNDAATCGKAGVLFMNYLERETQAQAAFSEDGFDGRQLTIMNLHNLTIEGEKGAEIVIEPHYATVLVFCGCENITLRNLTIGHVEEGYCEGAVIGLEKSHDITIENCDLYGCGTYGIEARYSYGIECINTVIRDCSYGIISFVNCSFANFEGCDFIRCREFSLIDMDDSCNNVRFSNCRFAQNNGKLFPENVKIILEDCEIHHPRFTYGAWNMDNNENIINRGGNQWLEDLRPLESRGAGPK